MSASNLPPLAEREQPWMRHGLCRGYEPSVFFPSDGAGVENARRICAECPVASECLEYALEYRIDHGVWGGVSERGRRRLLRTRAEEKRRRHPATPEARQGERARS